MMAHTGLKLLKNGGADSLIIKGLVPGAGLEPARTLPGPRDFKSHPYPMQQHPPAPKRPNSGRLGAGVCPFSHLPIARLVTGLVTCGLTADCVDREKTIQSYP